jgi:uncharacterized repeat protein (TIGR01451 family)
MPYKGSSWSEPSRGRVAVAILTLVATIAAGLLAATAMPAFAGGGDGHGGGNGNGNGNGQAASGGSGQSGSHGNGNGNGNGNGHSHGGGGGSSSGGQGNSGTGGHNNGGGNAGGNGNGATHVTICHATPPDTAAGGYVRIAPSVSGVYHGHLREHAADIIPPFVYDGTTYSLNWDSTGQAIWNNGCAVPAGTTVPPPSYSLGLSVQKLERDGTTGSFTSGPISAVVGDTIFYEIFVANIGNTPLDVTLSDPHCDAGTLMPTGTVTLAAGATEEYTCSHVLTSADGSSYVNTATASGYSSVVSATVVSQSTVTAGIAPASSGVAGAHKTKVKKVTHKARPAHAVVRGASFTG